MSDYGLHDEGLNIKQLSEIKKDIEEKQKNIFGTDFNNEPESPEGQHNGIISESIADTWEALQDIFDSFNPNAASGAALSNLVKINKIQRQNKKKSIVKLELIGEIGTIIPENSLFSSDNSKWILKSPALIGSQGVGIGYAENIQYGDISASSNTITNIDTLINGLNSVTNPEPAIVGRFEETDKELRLRRNRSTAIEASNSLDSMYSAVGNITGVKSLRIIENDTNIIDNNGLPPHSFSVIVSGGDDLKISETIWSKKPAGIMSNGIEEVEITDTQNIKHLIRFSRPTPVEIYIVVNLTVFEGFPLNGIEEIKNNIVNYAKGLLVNNRSFDLADNVIHSELYTPINMVGNHTVDDLFIGTSDNPTFSDDIIINTYSTSIFKVENITVNVTEV